MATNFNMRLDVRKAATNIPQIRLGQGDNQTTLTVEILDEGAAYTYAEGDTLEFSFAIRVCSLLCRVDSALARFVSAVARAVSAVTLASSADTRAASFSLRVFSFASHSLTFASTEL